MLFPAFYVSITRVPIIRTSKLGFKSSVSEIDVITSVFVLLVQIDEAATEKPDECGWPSTLDTAMTVIDCDTQTSSVVDTDTKSHPTNCLKCLTTSRVVSYPSVMVTADDNWISNWFLQRNLKHGR